MGAVKTDLKHISRELGPPAHEFESYKLLEHMKNVLGDWSIKRASQFPLTKLPSGVH